MLARALYPPEVYVCQSLEDDKHPDAIGARQGPAPGDGANPREHRTNRAPALAGPGSPRSA